MHVSRLRFVAVFFRLEHKDLRLGLSDSQQPRIGLPPPLLNMGLIVYGVNIRRSFGNPDVTWWPGRPLAVFAFLVGLVVGFPHFNELVTFSAIEGKRTQLY